jgi:hypothetical protein
LLQAKAKASGSLSRPRLTCAEPNWPPAAEEKAGTLNAAPADKEGHKESWKDNIMSVAIFYWRVIASD